MPGTSLPSDRMQARLESLCPGVPVWFRPDSGFRLSYPCIVFDLRNAENLSADDQKYINWYEYRVTLFTRDSRDENIYKLSEALYSKLIDSSQTAGLNRFAYNMKFY